MHLCNFYNTYVRHRFVNAVQININCIITNHNPKILNPINISQYLTFCKQLESHTHVPSPDKNEWKKIIDKILIVLTRHPMIRKGWILAL